MAVKATTTISDNFVRPDGALGPKWATVIPNTASGMFNALTGGILINNNGYGPINAGGGEAAVLWAGTETFGNDQWASATIKTVAPYTSQVSITAASQSGGSTTYTYTLTSGAALINPQAIIITGMGHAGNNGNFLITGLGGGTFTVVNASGVTFTENGTGVSPSDAGAGVMVRASGTTANTLNGYYFHVGTNSFTSPGAYAGRLAYREMWKIVNGVGSILNYNASQDNVLPQVGDTIAISAVGNLVTAYINGVMISQVTDSFISSGVPGIMSWTMNGAQEFVWANWATVVNPPGNNGTTYNNFQAGDLPLGTGLQLAANSLTGSPTQIASDNFNRADGPIGANWTTYAAAGLQIASNLVEATTTGRNGAFWNANAFNADQYSEITIAGTAGAIAPTVRCSTAGGENGYEAYFSGTFGSAGTMFFQRSVAGAVTNVSNVAATISVGDVVRIQAVGTTITIYKNGVIILTAQDTNLTSGSPGIFTQSNPITNAQASLWAGGNAALLSASFSLGAGENITPSSNGAYASAISGGWARAWQNTVTWPVDQYAESVLPVTPTNVPGPAVRMSNSANTFYLFTNASGSANIYRVVANVSTLLNSVAKTFTANDVYRLEIHGNILYGKVNGTIVVPVVDMGSSSLASGNAGFAVFNTGSPTANIQKSWAAGVFRGGTFVKGRLLGSVQVN